MNAPLARNIPQQIFQLVAELEKCIKRATRSGVKDEEAEIASLRETALNRQLQALGWGSVCNEQGRWLPIPDGYTIISNPPDDPHYYPQQRCSTPASSNQWKTLRQGEQEVRFLTWHQAYTFVFTYEP